MSSECSDFAVSLPDGRAIQVQLVVPPGPAPRQGWPVAYVLDLAQHRMLSAQADPWPGLRVGLGPQPPEDRRYDYVPPGAARWLRALPRVRAQVAARHPLDARRQALCGHSLGGLFALYVLLHQPQAFDGYVISSPSAWWGERYAERLLRRRWRWLCRAGLPRLGVALTVGEYEQGLGPEDAQLPGDEQARRLAIRRSRRMVEGMQALADGLAGCPGLRLRRQILPGYNHHTAAQAALPAGWRWLLEA